MESVIPIDLLELSMPITLRPYVPITDEQLMRFSERNRPYRIERNKLGEITIMTPVGGIGGGNEMLVSFELMGWARQDETGKAFSPSTGFNLPDGSCLSPDASWLSYSRWNALSLEQKAGYPPLCPDFVIEVRSRSDTRKLVEAKMQLWLENGAKLAWLIDPQQETVTIYTPLHDPETLEKPEMVLGTDPVAGFELHCSEIWASKS